MRNASHVASDRFTRNSKWRLGECSHISDGHWKVRAKTCALAIGCPCAIIPRPSSFFLHSMIVATYPKEGLGLDFQKRTLQGSLCRSVYSSRRELTMTMLSLVAVSQATLEKGSALRQASRTASEICGVDEMG